MKKFTSVMLIVLLIVFAGCSKNGENETSSGISQDISDSATEKETEKATVPVVDGLGIEELDSKKVLTVYFSHGDQVSLAASYITEMTKGNMFEVKTVNDYPENPDGLAGRAESEHEKGVRPALDGAPGSLKEYDIIFLCFPEWAGTMPMALWTFTEDYDMRGKAVVPVCEGSPEALEQAVRDIYSIAPGMTIVNGFSYSGDMLDSADKLTEFINNAIYGE